ncbi:transcription factor BIM2-like [Wolffia australiana]
MMEMGSRSFRSFMDDDNDDDDDYSKEGSSSKDVAVKMNCDQKPFSPRSKHSATEQRRRSRINERFRILRDLIPDSDQKIDKASFLLKVIEYIQILQEKLLKYEQNYSANSLNSEKLMPWKNNQGPGDASQRRNDLTATRFTLPSEGIIPHAPLTISSSQDVSSIEDLPFPLCRKVFDPAVVPQYPPTVFHKELGQPKQNPRNDVEEPQAVLAQRKCNMESCVDHSISNGEGDLVITEGTISLTCTYNDRLFAAFEKALTDMGVDLSQASLSVQINLARQLVAWSGSIPEEMEGQGTAHHSTSSAQKEDPGFGRGQRLKSDSGWNEPLSPSFFPLSSNDHSLSFQ